MQIAVFKDSRDSFLQALDEAGLSYETKPEMPGYPMASGIGIYLVAVAGTVTTAIATVFVAWLKARASREIIATLDGNKIVHLKGYSVSEAEKIIPQIKHMAAIDTKPSDEI